MTGRQQALAKVRADETRGPSDDDSQFLSSARRGSASRPR
jgi:hypothetical protein